MSEPTPSTNMRFLLFDGGPSEVVTIHILRHIEEAFPGFLKRTNVFAGTSAGGFTALSLSYELEHLGSNETPIDALDRCANFFSEVAQTFKIDWWNLLRLATGFLPLHSGKKLRNVLERHFGDKLLGALKPEVWLTVFNGDEAVGGPWLDSVRIVDAALASAAFPVLLPVYVHTGQTLVDGGLIDNSTLLTTLTRYLNNHNLDDCDQVKILSFGFRHQRDSSSFALVRQLESGSEYQYGLFWWLAHSISGGMGLLGGQANKEHSFLMRLPHVSPWRFELKYTTRKILNDMRLIMTNPDRLIKKGKEEADRLWYDSRNEDVASLRAWINDYWMKEKAASESHIHKNRRKS